MSIFSLLFSKLGAIGAGILGVLALWFYGKHQKAKREEAEAKVEVVETTLEVKDEIEGVKRLLTLCSLTISLTLSAGCATKQVIARPPLPDKLMLPSIERDKNDRTMQPGYWIDDHDARAMLKYREAVQAVKEMWH